MKLIIFDIDGTLCDSNNIDDECFVQAFGDVFSLNVSDTNWDNYVHVTDSAITDRLFVDRFGRKPMPEEIEKIKQRYLLLLKRNFNEQPTFFEEIDGAVSFIEELQMRQDWTVSIATGSWLEVALLKLKFINLNHQRIFIGHSNDHSSKHDILRSLIEDLRTECKIRSFERIIYVGDREYDFRTSQALNIEFIGVDHRDDGELRKLGVSKIIMNFKDKELFLFLDS